MRDCPNKCAYVATNDFWYVSASDGENGKGNDTEDSRCSAYVVLFTFFRFFMAI